MKNVAFWMLCLMVLATTGVSEELILYIRATRIGELVTISAMASNRITPRKLAYSYSPDNEGITFLIRSTLLNIPEDGILSGHMYIRIFFIALACGNHVRNLSLPLDVPAVHFIFTIVSCSCSFSGLITNYIYVP
jgi:hypothetical protein